MAATNYTPISLYYSTTAAAAPTSGNLVNGELGLNITDGKLYYKDNAGVVKLLASNAATTNVSTLSFGTTGLTPNTATSGAITVAGTLITSNGGTGLTTYTAGDLLYYAAGTLLSKLGIGTNGQVLTSSGTAPQYVAQSTLSVGSATTATNVAGGAAGSLIYQTAAATTSSLALGTTNYVLTAGASAPQYVAQSTLSVGSATTATNVAGGAAGSLIYQTAAATTSTLALGTTNYVLTAGASAPQYVAQSTLSVGTATNVAGGAAGSLVYQTAAATTSTLALGTSGYILTAGASAPTYIQTLPSANGGTGFSTYATGDILYASAANTLSKLAAGTNGYVLTLSGGVPTWASSAAASGVTSFSAGTTGFTPNTATTGAVTLAGTLATTNGGTGLTSFTANGIPYASSTSALTTGSTLTYNGTKLTVSGNITANNISVSGATGFGTFDSGMYVSAGKLNLASGGNTAITINSSAYVGVYTTTPTAKLHIVGTGQFQDSVAPTATNAFMLYSAPGTVSGYPGGGTSFSQVNVNSFLRGTLDYGDSENSSNITTAATVFIENAPATGSYTSIANPYALYIASGTSYFKGTVQSDINRTVSSFGTPSGFYTSSGTMTAATSQSSSAFTHFFGTPTFATASGSSSLTTASNVFIQGAPVAGTSTTIANPYALHVNAGTSQFGGKIAVNGGFSQAAWTTTGSAFSIAAATYTSTAGLTGTVAATSLAQPTFAATTASQTVANGATLYIAAAPAAGTNVTITNAYSLYISAGTAFFGGDLIGGSATLNLFNTTATTVNFAGAATSLSVGAATGTITIGNPTITATNATALNLNGASPSIVTSSTATASVFNTNATTGNLFGAATTIGIGATTGTLTLNNPTVVGSQTTVNLFNTTTTTLNFAGAATTMLIGTSSTTNFTLGGGTAAAGVVNLFAGPTSGVTINIGTALTTTSPINIGTALTTSSVSIGTAQTTGNIVLGNTSSTTGQIQLNSNLAFYQPAPPTTITASTTLTVANMKLRIIQVTSATAVTLTSDTGTNIDAAFSGMAVNTAFEFTIINTGSSAGAVTMAVATGVTYIGSLTVAISTSGTYRARKTAANTFVMYRVA